jgi:predicted phospho-2-dehydro-3-deoxyheptonate aldolase
MSHPGKGRRLERIAPSGRAVTIPMDHGVSSGPIEGLERPAETAGEVTRGGATSVVVHKGLVPTVAPALGDAGLIVHLSASTDLNTDSNDKRTVGEVREALALGADGISVHVNVGARTESRMVEDLGRVATACQQNGVPLLAMMYPRGPEVDDPHDVDNVAHVARLGAELGADLVKTPYTGDPDTFETVVDGCPVPVVISGGPKAEDLREVFNGVEDAVDAGAAGVSIGRNTFQADDRLLVARALARIVREGDTADEVLSEGKTAGLQG